MGFTIADQLAAELGIESQAPERFRAGLVHSLFQGCMDTGDTYMEARDLLEQTLTLLESSRPVELDPSQVAQNSPISSKKTRFSRLIPKSLITASFR